MLDFERVALAQAALMHRRIKQELVALGVGITPLLLVQVPNGGEAVTEAERVLVKGLKFLPSAVRKHTADEPDEHLAAIANDPDVEVLIFKMAIAMGFDAPRAFTLAALRGVRDREFGIQVVGRIMRVHRLLQPPSESSAEARMPAVGSRGGIDSQMHAITAAGLLRLRAHGTRQNYAPH